MRWIFRALLWLVALLLCLTLVIPYLLRPTVSFQQGPGGAVAYASLLRQLTSQAISFAQGKPVQLRLTEQEFSGLVSSAVLSGWKGPLPQPTVRSRLVENQIRLEAILPIDSLGWPGRLIRSVGLTLDLSPTAVGDGPPRFRILHGAIGRIPVSPGAIRLLGRVVAGQIPQFDPSEPALVLPVQELVMVGLNRGLTLQQMEVKDGTVMLTVSAHSLH